MTTPDMPGVYRQLCSRAFELLLEDSGLSVKDATEKIRTKLGRSSLSRQTLRDWRLGITPIPLEAFMALCEDVGPGYYTSLALRQDPDLAAQIPYSSSQLLAYENWEKRRGGRRPR